MIRILLSVVAMSCGAGKQPVKPKQQPTAEHAKGVKPSKPPECSKISSDGKHVEKIPCD